MEPKLPLVQHPMHLLIQEDTQCAERTPPWGAPSIEIYLERLQRNLQTLRNIPQLKLGYEWSAVELELLAERSPMIFKEMCDLVKEGACTFYNGTYSQPHLPILSSEANYRQFEYDIKVYRELCDSRVLTYAHQETSVHEQLPQLLDAFGIRFVTMPEFYQRSSACSRSLSCQFAWYYVLPGEDGLTQCLGIHQANQSWVSHEALGPFSICVGKPKQSSSMWQVRKQFQTISFKPSVEGSIANTFECKQDRKTCVNADLANDFILGFFPVFTYYEEKLWSF